MNSFFMHSFSNDNYILEYQYNSFGELCLNVWDINYHLIMAKKDISVMMLAVIANKYNIQFDDHKCMYAIQI